MVAVQGLVTYLNPMNGSMNDKWKLALKKEVDSSGMKNARTETVSPGGKNANPCKVVLRQTLDVHGLLLAPRLVSSQGLCAKGWILLCWILVPVKPCDVFLLIVSKFTSVGCHVHQAYISTAFLNKDIDGEL